MKLIDSQFNLIYQDCASDLLEDLRQGISIFYRFCKENGIYDYVKNKTTEQRLLGVMYDMRHWMYEYPCPFQHTYWAVKGGHDYKFTEKYLENYKTWCAKHNMTNLKPILSKY